MSYTVKIVGAGLVGNHLSHASRSLPWKVDLCDIDEAALTRTKNEIYPGWYGRWDPEIRLWPVEDAPTGGYDFIIIDTPPDQHIELAIAAVRERPRAVLVEKPLCTPDLDGAQALHELAGGLAVPVPTGYDHVVGKASEKVAELVRGGGFGAPETLDVEFREFLGGIFAAHPWLDGPADTYLGYWRPFSDTVSRGRLSRPRSSLSAMTNDLPALNVVGYPLAVADAHERVKAAAWFVLTTRGGEGVAREVVERVIDLENNPNA